MEQIKDTIKIVLGDIKNKKNKSIRENPGVWLKKTLAKKELTHAQFNYFSKGVLGIKVDSSAWLYHLSLQKKELLGKLSQYSKSIKDIRFSIGKRGE